MSADIKVQALPLFPSIAGIANFGEKMVALNKQLIADIVTEGKSSSGQARSGVNGVWQSATDMERRYESFGNLAKIIRSAAVPFLTGMGFPAGVAGWEDAVIVQDLWANVIDKPGASHMPHIHGDGMILLSGVYYPASIFVPGDEPEDLTAPAEIRLTAHPQPGDLVILNPLAALKNQVFPSIVRRQSQYFGLHAAVSPKQSNLIFFPSFQEHLVMPLVVPGQVRVSISFCVSIDGERSEIFSA